jgi:RNA polymerase-binding protein DksA
VEALSEQGLSTPTKETAMTTKTLNNYKQRLLALRERILGEVRSLETAVVEHERTARDLSDIPSHPADRDSEGIETDVALESSEWRMLEHVEEALNRIEEGGFGTCIDCGKKIPSQRLEAIPYALRCVPCEEEHERSVLY